MNILTLGASSSKSSINKQLAQFAAKHIEGASINTIDLNDFEMPILSVDRQRADGIPQAAQNFKKMISEADGIIISFAEHNGSYSAAFKNLMDWTSRLEGKLWMEKPMLLMASSPGGRGGQTVLNQATSYFPFMGGDVVAQFSLPGFYQNYSNEQGIKEGTLKAQFDEALQTFIQKLSSVPVAN